MTGWDKCFRSGAGIVSVSVTFRLAHMEQEIWGFVTDVFH